MQIRIDMITVEEYYFLCTTSLVGGGGCLGIWITMKNDFDEVYRW